MRFEVCMGCMPSSRCQPSPHPPSPLLSTLPCGPAAATTTRRHSPFLFPIAPPSIPSSAEWYRHTDTDRKTEREAQTWAATTRRQNHAVLHLSRGGGHRLSRGNLVLVEVQTGLLGQLSQGLPQPHHTHTTTYRNAHHTLAFRRTALFPDPTLAAIKGQQPPKQLALSTLCTRCTYAF